jgi:hypothetical protein
MRKYMLFYIVYIIFIRSYSYNVFNKKISGRNVLIMANPVNADGNQIRGDITEDEAFLWFDEALIYVRGGSGRYMISSKHSCNIYLHIHQLSFT